MKYEVRCACGKTHAVSAADAGVSLRCACGRTVEAPALHMLLASAGEMGVSPVVQLQAMLLQNELPGTNDCDCCHRGTEHLIRVSVVCERLIVKDQSSPGVALLGCALLGLLAGLAIYISRFGGTPTERGAEVSFVLPVRVCEVCERDVTAPGAVRQVLRTTPHLRGPLRSVPERDRPQTRLIRTSLVWLTSLA